MSEIRRDWEELFQQREAARLLGMMVPLKRPPEEDPRVRVGLLSIAIRWKLRVLWKVTGHCLFDDVPHKQLLERTLVIVQRYEVLLNENSEEKYESVLRQGLRNTVNVLRTEYYPGALQALGRLMDMKVTHFTSEMHGSAPVEVRDRLHAHVSKWLDKNSKHLTWDSSLGNFTRNGEQFELPEAVSKIMDEVKQK